jgi:hypothetical protein
VSGRMGERSAVHVAVALFHSWHCKV